MKNEESLRRFIENAAHEQATAVHAPYNRNVITSYNALIAYNRDLFFKLPIDAIESPQPFFYKNSNEMFSAIERNVYHVWNGDGFPTAHPFAQYGLYGVDTNRKHFLVSRIVHDYFGHYAHRIGFGTINELRLAAIAWNELPDIARSAHVCEFVTQICFFEVYGKYPEQKAFMPSLALMRQWERIVKTMTIHTR